MIFGKKVLGTISYLGGLMAVPEQFCWSWAQMVHYNAQYLVDERETIHYVRATCSFHSAARNWIVDSALGEFVLMLDSDHYFDPDLACRMWFQMKKDDLDVFVAPYVQKNPPHLPTLYKWDRTRKVFMVLGDWERRPEPCLIPVDSAGAGSLMVRKRVFERMDRELHESPFAIIPPYGEDHSFFLRCLRLKIQPWCNPHIQSWHLSVRPVGLEDFDREGFTMKQIGDINGNR